MVEQHGDEAKASTVACRKSWAATTEQRRIREPVLLQRGASKGAVNGPQQPAAQHSAHRAHRGHTGDEAALLVWVVIGVPVAVLAIGVQCFLARGVSSPADLQSWLVVACLAIVIMLSLLFEALHERWVEKIRGNEQYEHVVKALMKEVTLLGFVGFCFFLASKSGLVASVASLLPEHGHSNGGGHGVGHCTGHGHEDQSRTVYNSAYAPFTKFMTELFGYEEVLPMSCGVEDAGHELVEIFEDVHVLLFCAMTFVIALDIWLLRSASAFEALLHEMSSLSNKVLRESYKALRELDGRSQRELEKLEAVIRYRAIRMEFILPSVGPPDRSITSSPAGRFRFAVYLSLCCTERVLELVEVPPSNYGLVLLAAILARPLLVLPPPGLFAALAVFPVGLFAGILAVQLKLNQVVHMLTPPLARHLDDHGKHVAPFHANPVVRSSSTLTTWLCGTQVPDRQQQLFWFWANGPAFITHAIRLSLLLLACYLAVFGYTLYSLGRASLVAWRTPLLASTVVSLAAVCGMVSTLPSLLRALTIATSIEHMKHPRHIRTTLNLMRDGLHAQVFQMLVSLRRSGLLQRLTGSGAKAECAKVLAAFEHITEIERHQIEQAFQAFDVDKSGSINEAELTTCIRSFGLNAPIEEVHAILDAVREEVQPSSPDDAKADAADGLNRKGFIVVYMLLVELKSTPMDLQSLRSLFKEIDSDGNDRIDPDEVHASLRRHGAEHAMTLDDCRWLLQEVQEVAGGPAERSQRFDEEQHPKVEASLDDIVRWLRLLESRLHIQLVH